MKASYHSLLWAVNAAPILAASIGTPTRNSIKLSRASDGQLGKRYTTAAPGNECGSEKWALTLENYNKSMVDANRLWWYRGKPAVDTDGVQWPGVQGTVYDDMSNLFATQVVNLQEETCKNLQAPCKFENARCTDVGAWDEKTQKRIESVWGWLTWKQVTTFSNIASVCYLGAALGTDLPESLATDMVSDFSIVADHTFPIKLKNALLIISTVLAILLVAPEILGLFAAAEAGGAAAAAAGGAAAAAQEATAASKLGATAATVGAGTSAGIGAIFNILLVVFPGNTADSQVADLQKFVATMSQNIQDSLDSLAQKVFAQGVSDDISIFDVFSDGNYLTTTIPDINGVKKLYQNIFNPIMVNRIVREQTKKLSYLSFLELNDDENGTKCKADQSGVQETKYCADGGVYYLNSWSVGKGSYVTGPKGWDKLNKTEYNLTAEMVTESSAKSYRAALADGVTGVDLFNITSGSTYYQNELMTLLKNNQLTDAQQQSKRAAGTWTLPVCETTTVVNWLKDKEESKPPCMCGDNGKDTTDFVKGLGLTDCNWPWYCARGELADEKNWPDGVTEISYGELGTVKKGIPGKLYNSTCPDVTEQSIQAAIAVG